LRPFDVTIKDEHGRTVVNFKGNVFAKDQVSGRVGGPVKETLHASNVRIKRKWHPPTLKFNKQDKQASVRMDGFDAAGAWR